MKQRNFTRPGATTPSSVPELDDWLEQNPRIAEAIVWKDADKSAEAYRDWDCVRKGALLRAFRARWLSRRPRLADPPLIKDPPAADREPIMALEEADAWRLYKAHVAHSLVIEIRRQVPWKLESYSDEALKVLFAGTEMFERVTRTPLFGPKIPVTRYHVDLDTSGRCLPAPPGVSFGFMRPMIAATPLQTIGRLLDWCRDYLDHFGGQADVENMQRLWDYPGYPPASRMIKGTRGRDGECRHWTAGCWGTTGFLRSVLRVVNIPVSQRIVNTPVEEGRFKKDSLPVFWIGRDPLYLSHGDDPYEQGWKELKRSSEELLIDQETFSSWFGCRTILDEKGKITRCFLLEPGNLGRQVRELELQHLPSHLLHMHCCDVLKGRSQARSSVRRYFKHVRSLPELRAARLWERLEERRGQPGGCRQVSSDTSVDTGCSQGSSVRVSLPDNPA